MWGILFKTILIFLAIIGLTEVFRLLAFHFLRTRHRGKLFWTYSVSRCIIARIGIPVKGQNKKNSYKMCLRTGQQDPYDGGQTAAMP